MRMTRKKPLNFPGTLTIFMATILLAAFSHSVEAATINLKAHLDGSQEVPAVNTPGTGTAEFIFDTSSSKLSWEITFSGLSSAVTSALLQGPAERGENGVIQVVISNISGLFSPMKGSVTISNTQALNLLSGLWYINIRTGFAPGGEIRGQIEVSKKTDSQQLVTGDLDGNGQDDLVGLTVDGQIYYTLDLANWKNIPGQLNQIATGDLNGDSRADVIGLTKDGQIYYTLNLASWINIPGKLAKITIGDLNGDGKDDIAGLTELGQIYYTLDLTTWQNVPGSLGQITTGYLTASDASDLVGLTNSGMIYASYDLAYWWNIPGKF